MAAEVAIRLRVAGAEEASSTLARISNQLRNLPSRVSDTAHGLGELSETLTAGGAALAAFMATFGRLSGLRVASEVEAITNQLKVLTGDIAKARELTEAFYELGAVTRFNTNEVAAFGAALLAAGVDAERLLGDMQSLLDLIAAMGVRREDMQRVLENIVQVRGLAVGQSSMADIKQMFIAMPGIGVALGRALGREPLSAAEANQLLAQLGGERFYELLIRAAAQFEGASRELTILDTLRNIAESFERALIPTGELFGRVLRYAEKPLGRMADLLRRINELLYGVPGALLALTAGALAAAAALRVLAKVGVGTAAAQALGGLGGLGRLGRLGRFARAGIAGIGIGLLSELLGAGLESLGLKGAQDAFGLVGGAAGAGVMLGGLIGSVIPAIGTAIGAVVGGVVGALVGLYKLLTGKTDDDRQAADAQQQTAQNTARMARTLEDMRIQMVGGGARARSAVSRYEVEAYLRQLAASGI